MKKCQVLIGSQIMAINTMIWGLKQVGIYVRDGSDYEYAIDAIRYDAAKNKAIFVCQTFSQKEFKIVSNLDSQINAINTLIKGLIAANIQILDDEDAQFCLDCVWYSTAADEVLFECIENKNRGEKNENDKNNN
jgi:hypothetical protein